MKEFFLVVLQAGARQPWLLREYLNGYVLILLMRSFKKSEPLASRRSTSSVALCIYDESIMQGDRDVPSCYRVQQLARADALGYCARWCADGHHHHHRHVRHAHAHAHGA